MSTQMALDLFANDKPPKPTPLESFLKWAHDIHKCGHEIDAIAERLFAEMPLPFDRGKALVMVCGHGRFDQGVVDALGLFDAALEYHVCWDRAWAAVHGVPCELLPSVYKCDYNNRTPSFFGEDGELVCKTEITRRD